MDETQHTPLPRPELDPLALRRQRQRLFAELFGVEVEGARLDHYELLHELGRGAMGVVYAAHDTKLDRKVAIKQLVGDDPELRQRLVSEARAMAKLSHPNVVPVHEIGEVDGSAFIVMAHVEGQPLRAWLAAAPRSTAEILAVFGDAARGLAAVHAAGLVHRDVKPDNVMVGADGRARVMDFGVARVGAAALDGSTGGARAPARAGALTQTGALIGTPAYMAPEQLRGLDATPASDQFGFCVALFEALHGVRPFAADTVVGLLAAIEDGPPPTGPRASALPGWLRTALARGLAVDPDDRFASIDALLDALAAGDEPAAPPAFVYLAHRRPDTLAALELATALLEQGVRAYFGPWAGPRDESPAAAIDRAPALLICHGPGPWSAATIDPELCAALDRRIAALEVRAWVVQLPGATLDQLPPAWAELDILPPDAERLAETIGVATELGPGAGESEPDERPYPGPLPFGERDARWMFGRTEETAALIARLADDRPRFLSVVAAAGAGKSSLVDAGLCPLVRAGVLDRGCPWTIAKLRPGPEPCVALARALSSVAAALELDLPAPARLAARLRDSPSALTKLLRARPRPDAPLLLVVDQLEGLFAEAGLSPRPEPTPARAFVDNLVRATRADVGLRVLACLRADFLDRCLDIHPLARVLQAGGTFTLAPMGAAQLRAAIELPVRRVGYRIAPALVAELVAAASERAERLPLLQHVLATLWDDRDREARELSHAAYVDSGGLEGALTRSADAIFAALRRELGPPGERAVRQVMTRLVQPGRRERGDARRRAPRAELGDDRTTTRVIEALVGEARILVARKLDGREHVELAHEVLVREWAPLVAWLDAERDALRLREELRAGAERLAARDGDPDYLWGRGRVDEARRILADSTVSLVADERAFLARSEAHARQRERRILLGLGGAFTALAALLVYALDLAAVNEQQAAQNHTLAEARARAQAEADDGVNAQKGMRAAMLAAQRYDLEALLLAIEALGTYDLRAGRPPPADAYEGALAAVAMATILGPRARLDGHARKLVDLAFSPDGQVLASAGFDGRAQLWDAKSGELRARLDGHEGALTTVRFSPDGRLLASASWDDSVRLWDAQSGQLRAELRGHQGDVLALAFSPSGARLASAGADASVRLWDPATGAELMGLDGHDASVSALAFSPDGQTLASASHDTTARLWDAETGALRQTLAGHPSRLFALAFAPDGQTLATSGYEASVRRWSVETGAALEPLTGHRSSVVALAYAPDGQTLASASFDDSARLWDADTGELLTTFEGHSDDVLSLAFSPDGAELLTGSADGSARVWDTASGRERARLDGHRDAVLAVATSPTSGALATASADGSGLLWTPSHPRWSPEVGTHAGPVTALVHTRGGRLASAGHDARVRLWPAVADDHSKPARQAPAVLDGHHGAVLALAVSPDGRTLASAGHDATVRLWDTQSAALLARLDGHQSYVTALAFSPDGTTLASASHDATVRTWGARSHALLDTLDGHQSYITALAFAPDGRTLASASHDATVRLWDVELGQLRATLDGHRGYVVSLAFAPDGATLASGSWDRDLRLWDLATASALATLSAHDAPVTELLFDPDGDRLISADTGGTLAIWTLFDRRAPGPPRLLEAHAGEIFALALSPDATLVASASADDEVRLWHLDSAKLLARLPAHRDDVLALAFDPDGRSFVSAGADGRILRWSTPPTTLARACARARAYLDFSRVAELCK